jgi:hypothetical protein
LPKRHPSTQPLSHGFLAAVIVTEHLLDEQHYRRKRA